ncbi:MAG TPA: HAD-IC family P-type ATPase [Acidimicrobiia bacterium]|nr:HAD-IC family P-type ATPase [Acidimicrobiia bacterium]
MTPRAASAHDPARHGLTRAEGAEREATGRVNAVPTGPSRTVAQIFVGNVFTPFNLLLGALLVLVIFVAPFQDALFGMVLLANSGVGIIQELRAKRTLDRLAVLSAPRATVVREGKEQQIAMDRVVLDDLLVLRPGDQVGVDGEVLHSESLEVNESLLSGESDPVVKTPGSQVLSGSFVSSGSGRYRATKVGAEAYAVRLAEEAKRFTLVRSELRNGINRILKTIAWVMVPTVVLLVWSQMQLETHIGLKEALRATAAGIVAMVPEGLVLLTSVAFAVGVVRLGRRRVLVQELPAVEGLARVDVICFDKTGTLTEGRLTVESLEVLDAGHDPAPALGALAAADPNPNATMQAVAEAFSTPAGWLPTATVPFSSARKWSGASFGSAGSWVLGAPELMLPGNPTVMASMDKAAAQGRRVLLLARSAGGLDGEVLPGDLEAVAMVGLTDRIREDAARTLQYFAQQGVTAKVISGDNPQTVAAIAQQVGLAGAEQVVDARTLPEEGPGLADALEKGTIFGRVTPHQKRAMVAALQSRGHVVAMTGDGVNDVLALKDADIGIAMGSGAPASRAVAQLILLDGSFDTLPSVVAEGRRVIANIERVANLFLTKTVYAFLLAVLVGVFARPFPFVPRHLTVVGSLTIGIPAFFLALAPSASRARSGFVRRVVSFALPVGTLAAVATYGAYELAIHEAVPLIEARTLATLVLLSIGLFALDINARPLTPWRRVLIGGMAGAFLIVLASAGLREFFELQLPPLVVLLAGVGVVGLTGGVLYGSLRAVGWIQQVPQLLRSPGVQGGVWPLVRRAASNLGDRARRIGEPLDPGGPHPPKREPPTGPTGGG